MVKFSSQNFCYFRYAISSVCATTMAQLQRASLAVNILGSRLHKASKVCRRGFRITRRYLEEAKPVEEIKGTPYSKITIGVPKETFLNERRVAVVPATVATLTKKGFNVAVEENAGLEAKFTNDAYAQAGATITGVENVFNSDILLKIQKPSIDEVSKIRDHGTLISFLYPAQNKELIDKLAQRNATVFAMDCVPRISRAQVFDALSSMANIAGYKAVVEAANNFGRFFTGWVLDLYLLCFSCKVLHGTDIKHSLFNFMYLIPKPL